MVLLSVTNWSSWRSLETKLETMRLVWIFVFCGIATVVVCGQDNPGFFLKGSKNIPRVSIVFDFNWKMINCFI